MTLVALGLNHQTAPVALRERVAFSREALPDALRTLRGIPGVSEAALISTCNRSEIYAVLEPGAQAGAREFLARAHGLAAQNLDEYLYCHEDGAAVRHLYRVASGLDSMVLGEPQILGQVKEAYQSARASGALGPALERLFQSSFAVAKRVRTDTRIGASPVSVAYAAVRLASRVFGDFRRVTALLVGAGDTIELATRHLNDSGIGRLMVANRTYANAEALAQTFGAQPLRLAELGRHLGEADLVICSTASRTPIVTRAQVELALEQRRRRPMLFIDLAVPRDVEPAVAELPDVFLYGIDDLGDVIADSLRSRQEAAREGELIVDLQLEHFLSWWRGYDRHGALKKMRDQAERERDAIVTRARAELAHGRDAGEVMDRLAHALTNKLLHLPSINLRAAALRGDTELLRAAERLFGESTSEEP